MNITDKLRLIFHGILIVLCITFLVILYRYSENGRYSYHSHIYSDGEDRYVLDTRTGTMYGHFTGDKDKGRKSFSYKSELLTNKEWEGPITSKGN